MKLEPIIIEIEEPKKFVDVAFLVDRPEFIEKLIALRKAYKLDNSLLKPNPAIHWEAYDWNATTEQKLKQLEVISPIDEKLQNPSYIAELSIPQREKLLADYQKALRTLPSVAFAQDIQSLRKSFKKPPNFDRIIAHAVMYGVVKADDYVTCEMIIDFPEWEYIDYDAEAKPVIRLYPNVTLQDIEKLFRTKAKELFDEYQKQVLGGRSFEINSRGMIKRDREWYWQNKKGMSYTKIARTSGLKGEEHENIQIVAKAIGQYKRTLALEI